MIDLKELTLLNLDLTYFNQQIHLNSSLDNLLRNIHFIENYQESMFKYLTNRRTDKNQYKISEKI